MRKARGKTFFKTKKVQTFDWTGGMGFMRDTWKVFQYDGNIRLQNVRFTAGETKRRTATATDDGRHWPVCAREDVNRFGLRLRQTRRVRESPNSGSKMNRTCDFVLVTHFTAVPTVVWPENFSKTIWSPRLKIYFETDFLSSFYSSRVTDIFVDTVEFSWPAVEGTS